MGEYSDRIAKAIVNNTTLSDVRPNTGFYPSSASIRMPDKIFGSSVIGGCNRQTWYRWFRYPEDGQSDIASVGRLMVGQAGHLLAENILQTYVSGTGLVLIRSEHSFWTPSTRESGRIDLLCYDTKNNQYVIFEVKTINDDWGKSGLMKASVSPKDEYILQALVYKKAYKRLNPRVIILYINMGIKRKTPTFLFDYEILGAEDDTAPVEVHGNSGTKKYEHITTSNIRSRWTELEKYIRNKELPPADYRIQYTEEEIVGLYKENRLEYKAEQKTVETWLTGGAIPDTLLQSMPYGTGDSACGWCPYKKFCRSNIDNIQVECPTDKEMSRFLSLEKTIG